MVVTKPSFVVFMIFITSLFLSITSLPGKSFSDVSEPADEGSEDLAGILLIGSNIAIGGFLGSGLAADSGPSGMGYFGIGLGLGSIALGVTETTSFSGGVIVAGSVVTALGLMNLLSNSDTDSTSSEDNISKQGTFVTPYLAGIEKGERGLGLLVRKSF